MNHIRQTLATALGVGVGFGVVVSPQMGFAAGCACGAAQFLFHAFWDVVAIVFARRPSVPPVVLAKPAITPPSPPTPAHARYVDVDNWESSHPELPYMLTMDELGMVPPRTSRQIDKRRQYIRRNCVGKYGIFMYEDTNGKSVSAYGFSDEKFALSLKMGLWPEEM